MTGNFIIGNSLWSKKKKKKKETYIILRRSISKFRHENIEEFSTSPALFAVSIVREVVG